MAYFNNNSDYINNVQFNFTDFDPTAFPPVDFGMYPPSSQMPATEATSAQTFDIPTNFSSQITTVSTATTVSPMGV